MAFTKAPEYNTHQLQRIPIDFKNTLDTGYEFYYPKFFNCFPNVEGDRVYVNKRETFATEYADYVSIGVYRGMMYDPEMQVMYVAHEDDLYCWSDIPADTLTVTAGVFSTNTFRIASAKYRNGPTIYNVMCENTGAGDTDMHYWVPGDYNAPTSTTTISSIGALPYLVFIDGYLLFADNNQRVYNSAVGNPTTWYTTTDYLDAEMVGDAIAGIAKHHNHLVVFGTRSIEFFYNAGNAVGSPFSRQANYSINLGATLMVDVGSSDIGYMPSHIVEIGDVIYFLGGPSGAASGIYKIENFKAEKISDDWVTQAVARNGGVTTMMYYSHMGEACLLVGSNLVYKPSTKSWSQISVSMVLRDSVPGGFLNEGGAYWIAYNSGTDYYSLMKSGLRTSNLLDVTPESISASYVTQNIDFMQNSLKHFKWVDVLGNFGNNGVTFAYSKDLERSSASFVATTAAKYQSTLGQKNPLRWRNLGRARGNMFAVTFLGTDNIDFAGFEVAYNGGTY